MLPLWCHLSIRKTWPSSFSRNSDEHGSCHGADASFLSLIGPPSLLDTCMTPHEIFFLSFTFTWCKVDVVLCIWSILFRGGAGSCCAAPGHQIQICISTFSQGHWLDSTRLRVFDDCGEHLEETHTDTWRTCKALPTWKLKPGPSCREAIITTPQRCWHVNMLCFSSFVCVFFMLKYMTIMVFHCLALGGIIFLRETPEWSCGFRKCPCH